MSEHRYRRHEDIPPGRLPQRSPRLPGRVRRDSGRDAFACSGYGQQVILALRGATSLVDKKRVGGYVPQARVISPGGMVVLE